MGYGAILQPARPEAVERSRMPKAVSLSDALRVKPGAKVRLAAIDPAATHGFDKASADREANEPPHERHALLLECASECVGIGDNPWPVLVCRPRIAPQL